MTRNIDLIRDLLLYVEAKSNNQNQLILPHPKSGLNYDANEVDYALKLVSQKGLIQTQKTHQSWLVQSLTWEGHEFLDATRDDKIWKKVTREVAKKGGGFTIDILKALAIKFLNEQLGLG